MPELPMLRNSERHDCNTCPQKWDWRWNDGLIPRITRQSAAWFGGVLHVGLAEWYQPKGAKNGFVRGRDPRETIKELFKDQYATVSAGPYFDEVAEKEYWDAAELGNIMLTAYLAHYGTDPTWEVLMPEMRFHAKIPYNAHQLSRIELGAASPVSGWLPEGKFITQVVGTMDMAIRDHGDNPPHVKVIDHKTTNKKENTAWLIKDNQTGLYIAISTANLRRLGLIGEKEAVVGAIWNYLRKGKPDVRPTDAQGRSLNKDGTVSKTQPSPLFWREDLRRNKHNRLAQIARVADEAEHMAAMRAGVMPITKAPGEHCAWCDFKELCDVHEDGGDVEQFKKDVFVYQDPYADHREGALNSKESAAAKKVTGVV